MTTKELYELVKPICDDERVGWPLHWVTNSPPESIKIVGWAEGYECSCFEPIEEHAIAILTNHLMAFAASKSARGLTMFYSKKSGYSVDVDRRYVGPTHHARTLIEALAAACRKILEDK